VVAKDSEEVLLSSEHLSLRGEHPKFFPKFVGPFTIAALRGVNTSHVKMVCGASGSVAL